MMYLINIKKVKACRRKNVANPLHHTHPKGELMPQLSNGLILGGFGIQNNFDGLIDEFRIYNRVLSIDEINTLYEMR